MKNKYGDNCTLLFTDTDSLCYEVKTDDLYLDMRSDIHLYDFSDYPKNNPLHNVANKKVLGKLKDETNSRVIAEFVGVKCKMYSILCENVEKKVAKGISKTFVAKHLRHQHYKNCLFNEERTRVESSHIRSKLHNVYTLKQRKIGLSPYDDKRFVLHDGINCRAIGHFLNKQSVDT